MVTPEEKSTDTPPVTPKNKIEGQPEVTPSLTGSEHAAVIPTAYDFFISVTAVVTIFLTIWRLLLTDGTESARLLDIFDYFFCLIFFIDFLRNFIKAPSKKHYLITWGWLDLISSVPAIPALRFIRVLHILRILRVIRSIRILIDVFQRDRPAAVIALALILVIAGMMGICVAVLAVERHAPGANIKTAEDVAWWAVVTASTVGYGEHYPITHTGQILAVVLMIFGIGMFAALAGGLAGILLQPASRERETTQILKQMRQLHSRMYDIEGHVRTHRRSHYSAAEANKWFEQFQWLQRMLVVNGPRGLVNDQFTELEVQRDGVLERDLLVIDINHKMGAVHMGSLRDIPESTHFSARFDIPADGHFHAVLIGKDGEVKVRREEIIKVKELFKIIDSMPMRQDEIKAKK